jgi:hypothetical protein
MALFPSEPVASKVHQSGVIKNPIGEFAIADHFFI